MWWGMVWGVVERSGGSKGVVGMRGVGVGVRRGSGGASFRAKWGLRALSPLAKTAQPRGPARNDRHQPSAKVKRSSRHH